MNERTALAGQIIIRGEWEVHLKLPVCITQRGPNNALRIADADHRIICEIQRGKEDVAIAEKIVACLNRRKLKNVVVPDPSRSSAKI